MSSLSVSWQRILTQQLYQSHSRYHCTTAHMKSSQVDFLYSSVLLELTDWLLVRVLLPLLLLQSESESHCDWRSVSLSVLVYDQILVTVWQLLSCSWEGALSDERTGLSFVSQSAVLGQLSVCNIFIFYMCHMLLNTYTIYTRPLSVLIQYSRLCPISGSFPITAV
jgi:hypothetical protein